MNFKIIILVATVLFCKISFGQSKEVDSLINIVNNKNEDTSRVSTLIRLSEVLVDNSNYDSAKLYAAQALGLSEKLNFSKGRANAYRAIGRAYVFQINLSEAMKNHLAGLKINEELNDKAAVARSYIDIGTVYYKQDNDPEALKFFYNALKIFEEIGDQKSAAKTLGWIANTYYYLENYVECEKNHLAALKINKAIADKPGVAYSSKVLAMLYIMQADSYYSAGDRANAERKYTEASERLQVSLKVFEAAGNKVGLLETYIFLSRLYQSFSKNALTENNRQLQNEYQGRALKISLSAIKIAKEIKDKNYMSEYCNDLGLIYTSLKNYSVARKYLDQALRLSKEIRFKTNVMDSYNNLVKLDSSEGNFKEAYMHYKQFITYRDSVVNEERTKESTQAKLQYEFDKKEDSLNQKHLITQTKLDSQKKQKNFYLIGAGLLGLLSLFVFLNFRNQKKINRLANDAHAKEKAELELQSLRAQLNPHFMFNSLNAIQELILLEENERSQSYLARFSKLLRMLLENADKPFIPLQREIDFLQLYLALENLRIPDLQFSIDIDTGIDTEKTLIPNMILQPYIENAIWHGLSHKENDKQLQIRINNEAGSTKYEVEDNGVGRKRSAELKSLYRKEHKSKGMELLSKRFKLLAKEYGSDIETEINDVLNDNNISGTLVTIKVPVELTRTKVK